MERMYITDAKFVNRKHGPQLTSITMRVRQVDDARLTGLAITPIKVYLDGKCFGYLPMSKFSIKAEHPNTKGTKYYIILSTHKPAGLDKLPFYKDMKIKSLLGKPFLMKAVTKEETDKRIVLVEDKSVKRKRITRRDKKKK